MKKLSARPPKILKALCSLMAAIVTITLQAFPAIAGDYRLGVSGGVGGSGIKRNVEVRESTLTVERSESPGIFSFFADYQYSDDIMLSVEHIRGFRFAPFSSGSAFTGLVQRWYLWGPIPSIPKVSNSNVTLSVKNFAPYIGGSFGVAFADISRDNDEVPHLNGSGIYMGFKGGADFPVAPGVGVRPEISVSTTIPGLDTNKTVLSQFAIHLGLYFHL